MVKDDKSIFSTFNVETVIRSQGNNVRDKGGLEVLLRGIYSGKESPYGLSLTTPMLPSYETDYGCMRTLAVEEDDFRRVVDAFSSVVRKMRGGIAHIARAKEVLHEAHNIYVDTQKALAMLFGTAGQFELAEEHLRNAHFSCKIGLNYSDKITLECRVSEQDVRSVIDNAKQHTSPEYFLRRVARASEEGDVEETRKYVALTLRSLEARGEISIPTFEKKLRGELFIGQRYDSFIKVILELDEVHQKAYRVAIQKKVGEAVGYAVQKGGESLVTLGVGKIEELYWETRELISNAAQEILHKFEGHGYDEVQYFNDCLTPLFEELKACRRDKEHPLRSVYRTKMKTDYDSGKTIVSCEQIPVEATAIVPRLFYQEMFERTGTPHIVHPFFNPIVERYNEARHS